MLNLKSCAHRGVFRTKSNICNETFFTLIKPYFKFDRIAFRFHFLHNSPFCEKLTTPKTSGESLLLTMEHFFLKFEIMQRNGIINEGFLNQHLLKVLKLLAFVLFSFFFISYGSFQILWSKHFEHFFKNNAALFNSQG